MSRWSTEWVDAGEDCVSTENVLKGSGNMQGDHKLSVGTKLLVEFETIFGNFSISSLRFLCARNASERCLKKW